MHLQLRLVCQLWPLLDRECVWMSCVAIHALAGSCFHYRNTLCAEQVWRTVWTQGLHSFIWAHALSSTAIGKWRPGICLFCGGSLGSLSPGTSTESPVSSIEEGLSPHPFLFSQANFLLFCLVKNVFNSVVVDLISYWEPLWEFLYWRTRYQISILKPFF